MYEPTDKQINDYYWNRYGQQSSVYEPAKTPFEIMKEHKEREEKKDG